jgi:hypothetical protein
MGPRNESHIDISVVDLLLWGSAEHMKCFPIQRPLFFFLFQTPMKDVGLHTQYVHARTYREQMWYVYDPINMRKQHVATLKWNRWIHVVVRHLVLLSVIGVYVAIFTNQKMNVCRTGIEIAQMQKIACFCIYLVYKPLGSFYCLYIFIPRRL